MTAIFHLWKGRRRLPVQIKGEKENIFNIYYLENTFFPRFAEAKYLS